MLLLQKHNTDYFNIISLKSERKIMKCVILVIICVSNVWPGSTEIADNKDRCTSLSCVHASASIIDLIESEIDPCNDFYGYACGNFVEEVYTPDEKSTLDTLTLMGDKLTEYLLTLYTTPILDNEPKIHELSKRMFQSCERFGKRFYKLTKFNSMK